MLVATRTMLTWPDLQVRDLLTSTHEQGRIRAGAQERGSLARDALPVDAIVSTIGFPLVGGRVLPAATHLPDI